MRITGHSMSPRIPHNSYVLIHTWLNLFKHKLGDTLLINHITYGNIIKTLSHKDQQGCYWFTGENEQSVSMSEIGPIRQEQILGKVCMLIRAKN